MTNWLKRTTTGFLGIATLMMAASAHAQDATTAPPVAGGLTPMLVIGTIVYSILGLIILLVGFKVFDVFTPYKLHKELAEDQNVAIGVMVAGLFIALAIIIASAIVG